jgi:hypothetical protein
MNPGIAADRYAEVARRELNGPGLRAPVWQEALAAAVAGGDAARVDEAYVRLRVTQMISDEAERAAARSELRRLQREHDGLALSPLMKRLCLSSGLGLSFVLYWFLSK